MVFAKRDHTHACKQFMSEYLDTYERWPRVDFSVGDRIDQDIVVHTLSERDLDFIAMYSQTQGFFTSKLVSIQDAFSL